MLTEPLKHAHRFVEHEAFCLQRSARRISDGFSCRTFTLRRVLRQVRSRRARRLSPRQRPEPESSRGVSDPTRGPRAPTPGSVPGSLTSRLPVTGTTLELGSKTAPTSLGIGAVKCAPQRGVEVRLISSDIVDGVRARVSVVVELGTLVHAARRIAHGTARRDGGGCPRYAGASDWVRTERRRGPIHDPCRQEQPPADCIVEPDVDASVLVVVTAYEVSE
jgi:hypothetical protein